MWIIRRGVAEMLDETYRFSNRMINLIFVCKICCKLQPTMKPLKNTGQPHTIFLKDIFRHGARTCIERFYWYTNRLKEPLKKLKKKSNWFYVLFSSQYVGYRYVMQRELQWFKEWNVLIFSARLILRDLARDSNW